MTRAGSSAALAIGALTWLFGLPSCFFYDSRWGQAEDEQRRTAAHLTPAKLRAADRSKGPTRLDVRQLGLRVHVTPSYAGHSPHWKKEFEITLEDANHIIARSLGIRVSASRYVRWEPNADESDLAALNFELRARDPGADIDWVVGLTGALPKFVARFDRLGNATILGKHIVLRAAVSAEERDAIEAGFDELDESERIRLLQARKHHKNTAVLLHELGHTLGAPHVRNAKALLAPKYNRAMSAYSSHNLAVMRVALAHRLKTPESHQPGDLEHALLAVFERNPEADWVPESRQSVIEQIQASLARAAATSRRSKTHAGPAPAQTHSSRPKKPTGTSSLEAVAAADRESYSEAEEHFEAKRWTEAWSLAEPLFERYSDVAAIQELRCKLAMRIGLGYQAIIAHCRRFRELNPRGEWGHPSR